MKEERSDHGMLKAESAAAAAVVVVRESTIGACKSAMKQMHLDECALYEFVCCN